jgi:hypothetical protein
MHKARENGNGTFSIGKTWVLDDLTAVESFSGATPTNSEEEQRKLWASGVGFTVTITKPYYWQAGTAKEKEFFIASLIKIYRKYTGGRVPRLTGFDARETEQFLGLQAGQIAQNKQSPQLTSSDRSRALQQTPPSGGAGVDSQWQRPAGPDDLTGRRSNYQEPSQKFPGQFPSSNSPSLKPQVSTPSIRPQRDTSPSASLSTASSTLTAQSSQPNLRSNNASISVESFRKNVQGRLPSRQEAGPVMGSPSLQDQASVPTSQRAKIPQGGYASSFQN